jgi:hypothetical protein
MLALEIKYKRDHEIKIISWLHLFFIANLEVCINNTE